MLLIEEAKLLFLLDGYVIARISIFSERVAQREAHVCSNGVHLFNQ